MAYVSKVELPDQSQYDIRSKVTAGILYGQVDATSTATAFTATIPGVTEYYDGLTIMLKNGVVTSASGFTININGLGAKHSYNNLTAATADTTLFNVNYTMLFVYDSTRVSGGGWICYRGYDANTNTIGYQVRTNSTTMPMKSYSARYRLFFTASDGQGFVPANNSTSTNATATRTPCQDKIDPFGPIYYYGTTGTVAAGARPSAAYLWQQYLVTLGYSFNKTGVALDLVTYDPVYVVMTPQTDGSAIIDATTPFVQALPSTEDGKIYVFLGIANSDTQIELNLNHPVYEYKDGAIRSYTNAAEGQSITVDTGMDTQSTNPVQNGVIATALNEKQDKIYAILNDSSLSLVHNLTETTIDGVHGFLLSTGVAEDWFFPDGTGLNTVLTGLNTTIATKISGSDVPSYETDPTVPAWAKAATKPSYTASEVGALPSTTVIPSATSDLTNDSGFISTETDPTVPAWAKAATKPSYTASEVGALPDTTAIPTKTSDLTNDSGFVTSDVNVTQTAAAPSTYTYWRPLVIGGSSGASEGFSPSTTTGGTYTFSTLTVQPSTGTIRAGKFKGELNGSISSATTATTQASSDNSTKVATTAFVQGAVTGLQTTSITDTGGYFTTDTVEGALQQLGATVDGIETLLAAI